MIGMSQFVPWKSEAAREIVAAHARLDGAALPILHALQDKFGYIDEEAIGFIADALNLSRAEIRGVISFYHDFRRTPPGRHILKLCRAEACQATGAAALHRTLQAELGIGWHGTTPDGGLTLEPVLCLGLCALGPAGMYDDALLARLDQPTLGALVAGASQ